MVEKIQEKKTVIVYSYRYVWKTREGRLCIKFVTEPQEGHALFQQQIRDNPDIVSCVREYLHEVNFEYLGFTEPVKEEKKENENETKS